MHFVQCTTILTKYFEGEYLDHEPHGHHQLLHGGVGALPLCQDLLPLHRHGPCLQLSLSGEFIKNLCEIVFATVEK